MSCRFIFLVFYILVPCLLGENWGLCSAKVGEPAATNTLPQNIGARKRYLLSWTKPLQSGVGFQTRMVALTIVISRI